MNPILAVADLTAFFHTRNGIVRAVDGVSLDVARGETIGLVGESGSGKSVTASSLLRLLPMPPARIESGQALFGGIDLLRCPPETLRAIRGQRISMVFQDPMTSLNPYINVGKQVMEPLTVHHGASRQAARDAAVTALEAVGVPDAARRMEAFPHQFSGGMRQRVMIAMALITRPELLIADEPTTALDVTVQAQVLDLLKRRQRDLGMAVILITHDLGVVAEACDRVYVMYAGRILESGDVHELFHAPKHPYTRALMDALPTVNTRGKTLHTIPGQPPNPTAEHDGCPFAPRCAHAIDTCLHGHIALAEIAPERHSACIRVQRGDLAP